MEGGRRRTRMRMREGEIKGGRKGERKEEGERERKGEG